MNNLLYVIAVILILFWAVGFFGYHSYGGGNLIHLLLVIAVIAIVLKYLRDGRL